MTALSGALSDGADYFDGDGHAIDFCGEGRTSLGCGLQIDLESETVADAGDADADDFAELGKGLVGALLGA